MELRTCRNCKRLYNHFVGQNMCPDCIAKLDEVFRNVKAYVYDNPNASIHQVAEEFDISVKVIHGWVREERLEFSSGSGVGLPCEVCGDIIQSGRFCNKCKKNIVQNLSTMYSTKMEQTNDDSKSGNKNKMRFL